MRRQDRTPPTEADAALLRGLARRVRDIAALPEMEERRRLWERHNALRGERPMVLAFPEGSWEELLPPDALACTTGMGRRCRPGSGTGTRMRRPKKPAMSRKLKSSE